MAEAYGVEFAEFLSGYMNMTEEQFKEQAQEVAETAVKRDLACKLLAEKKNLEPSDKEYEEMAETYAKQSNYEDVETFKKKSEKMWSKARYYSRKSWNIWRTTACR